MLISLSDLFVALTKDTVLSELLDIATTTGMPTTAWQPMGAGRTQYATTAQKIADLSSFIVTAIAGGFLEPAATVTPEGGQGWLDLVAHHGFAVDRVSATFAPGSQNFVNSGGVAYPVNVGDVTISNPTTGQTYHNSQAGTIAASATTPLTIVADVAGAAGTSGPGTITNMVTPLLNVTTTNPLSVVGTDSELNASVVQRCKDKLASLAFNGPAGAYAYFAKGAATSVPINRVATVSSAGTGSVTVYIANANGTPSGGDVTIVNAALQALATPLCITLSTVGCFAQTVNITYTAYVAAIAGYSGAAVQAAISARLASFFATFPIGGITTSVPNQLTVDSIVAQIFQALPAGAILEVKVSVPAADVTLGSTSVPALGALTPTVVLV